MNTFSDNLEKFCIFATGVVFGTAGIKLLSTKEAKKVYTHLTAAGIRAGKYLDGQAKAIEKTDKEIYADAQALNAEREA